MAVTKRQAEQALAAVRRQFGFQISGPEDGPKLVHNWDWLESGPTKWAIVWEEGPFEWAYRAQSGGVDEELTAAVRADYPDYPAVETPAAIRWPAGTFAEPVTSWAVGIYEV